MGIEERLQVLEEETQLVRGELKQTLVNVRDFLLDLNLPALQEEEQREIHEHNESHGGEGHDKPSAMDAPAPPQPQAAPPAAAPAAAPLPPAPQPVNQGIPPSMSQITTISPNHGAPPPPTSFSKEELFSDQTEEHDTIDNFEPFDGIEEAYESPQKPSPQTAGVVPETANEIEEEFEEIPDQYIDEEPMGFSDNYEEPASELPADMSEAAVEEPPIPDQAPRAASRPEPEKKMRPVVDRSSQINLLTNLIRWVTVARKEIGMEYLPAFLDVYGIGDQLLEETREIIMYLAETISPRPLQPSVTLPVAAGQREPVTEDQTDDDETGNAGQEPELTIEAPPVPVQPVIEPNGEVWNRMILELHGILRCSNVCFEDSQLPWKRVTSVSGTPEPAKDDLSKDIADISVSDSAETGQDIENAEISTETEINDDIAATERPESIPEDSLDIPEGSETLTEDTEEPETPKKKSSGRTKNNRKKQSGQEPVGARLKLVIPVGDDHETEIEIGAFNLSLSRSSDSEQ